MTKVNHKHSCPVRYVLDLFGDKWTLLILRDMIFQGKNTYSDFLASAKGIATNILADRLCKLECSQIISKQQDANNKRSYIYSLTKRGIDLVPIFIEIILWGSKYLRGNQATRDFVSRANQDKAALIKSITDRLRKELEG